MGRQIAVVGLTREVEDGGWSQPPVEVVVQQHLGRPGDEVFRDGCYAADVHASTIAIRGPVSTAECRAVVVTRPGTHE